MPPDDDPEVDYALTAFLQAAAALSDAVDVAAGIHLAERGDYRFLRTALAGLFPGGTPHDNMRLRRLPQSPDVLDLVWAQSELRRAFEEGLAGVKLYPFMKGFEDTMRTGRPETRLAPRYTCESLLSAMWLQLYQAVMGARAPRQCLGCGRMFESGDPRRVFHNYDCKHKTMQAAYRRRQRQGSGG
jgi:hypothetical protein